MRENWKNILVAKSSSFSLKASRLPNSTSMAEQFNNVCAHTHTYKRDCGYWFHVS